VVCLVKVADHEVAFTLEGKAQSAASRMRVKT
jgi:hypothetical protein